MTVFDVMVESPYEFLTIKRGTVYGNQITATKTLSGIFNLGGSTDTDMNMEVRTSDARLHVHPEDYSDLNIANVVGQGVRVNGVAYEIVKVIGGENFDSGVVEHYTFELERASYGEN